MRIAIFTTILLVTARPAAAQEKAKPNALTTKEVADGWILLFDGETTFGWRKDGEGTTTDGWLIAGGKTASQFTFGTEFPSGIS